MHESVWVLAASAALILSCRSEALGSGDGKSGGGGVEAAAGGAGVTASAGTGGVSSARYEEEVLDGGEAPDCGPGCRVVLKQPVVHAFLWGHAYGPDAVADTGRGLLMYARVESNESLILRRGVYGGESPSDNPVLATIQGDLLAYVSLTGLHGKITVYDRSTKLHSEYFEYDQQSLNIFQLLVTNDYVFWLFPGGTGRAALNTGEIRVFPDRLSCQRACVMGGHIVCANEGTNRMERINPETMARSVLDDGGTQQLESGCSPDGARVVWVDFRDPPGTASTVTGRRVGSDIYLYEEASKETRRLTFDAPERSVPKAFAAVGDDLAVWLEPCEGCGDDFQTSQEFYAVAKVLVKFNLSSGERCRLAEARYGGWVSVHGHHLYSYWASGADRYLVDVDLDHPDIPWVCDPKSN